MAQNNEYKIQTGPITPPAAGYVKVYANPSGALVTVNSAGVTGNATYFGLNVSQVGGVANTGVALSGAFWLPVTGPSGELLVIPAFRRTS